MSRMGLGLMFRAHVREPDPFVFLERFLREHAADSVSAPRPRRSVPVTTPTSASSFASFHGSGPRARTRATSEGDMQLTLEIARPHRIALFTFVLDDADDLAWAKSVAATVR